MSLWLSSLEDCLGDCEELDHKARAHCIIAHLSMQVPRYWWEEALQAGFVRHDHARLLYDLQKELIRLLGLERRLDSGLLVALAFVNEREKPRQISIEHINENNFAKDCLNRAKVVLDQRPDLKELGEIAERMIQSKGLTNHPGTSDRNENGLERKRKMDEQTKYSRRWKMQEVVPYLLKCHFGNRPTSNKDISEAFWKLMGENLEVSGTLRWTTGKNGVPYHIHRLVGKKVLALAAPENRTVQDLSYPEHVHSYVLGPAGESMIESFEKKYGSEKIAQEMKTFLSEQPEAGS